MIREILKIKKICEISLISFVVLLSVSLSAIIIYNTHKDIKEETELTAEINDNVSFNLISGISDDLNEQVSYAIYDSKNIAQLESNNISKVSRPLSELGEPFEPYWMYVNCGWLNVRSSPKEYDDSNIIDHFEPGEEVLVVGEVEGTDFLIIDYTGTDDGYAYLESEYLEEVIDEEDTYNKEWTGKVLNVSSGNVKGPSGNETYYNLNMAKVVYTMNQKGYYGKVWTRSDGVKMFGNYIMCAADLSIRPKGTLVESTLGTCIVVDTGAFVEYDSTRLDIAANW